MFNAPVRFHPEDPHKECIVHESVNLSRFLYDKTGEWKCRKEVSDSITIHSFEDSHESSGILRKSTAVIPAIKCVGCLYEAVQNVSTSFNYVLEITKEKSGGGLHAKYNINFVKENKSKDI